MASVFISVVRLFQRLFMASLSGIDVSVAFRRSGFLLVGSADDNRGFGATSVSRFPVQPPEQSVAFRSGDRALTLERSSPAVYLLEEEKEKVDTQLI